MNGKDLVLRIIQLHSGVATTRLVKLVYLFDLACVQYFGKPKSGFKFIWHYYGPYSEEIIDRVWDLELENKITKQNYQTSNRRDCCLHLPVTTEAPIIPAKEEQILEYVVRRFGSMSIDDLLKYAYGTPPMLKAQKGNARGHPLDLLFMGDIPSELRDTTVLDSLLERTGKRTRWIPEKEVLRKLDEKLAAIA